MKRSIPKGASFGALAAALAVGGVLAAPIQAANPIPVVETKDKVAARVGVLRNGARFTPGGGGRSGQPSDSAMNFPTAGSGPVYVADGSFFNTAAANDEVSVAFWAKKYDIVAGSAFWANSPSSNNGTRGYQAHVPWDNSNIYFDHAGCCNADQRINAGIDTFPGYTGDVSWWMDWHHFIFSKKGGIKQIWIDGVLFLEGADAAALPTDFTDLYIGSDGAGGGLFHALVDDFAVFGTQLTEADAVALAGTTLPSALTGKQLLAYWDFNDIPTGGQFVSLSPTPDTTSASPNLIQVVHIDGGTAWTQDNVSLAVDGVTVAATLTKDGATATLKYVPNPFFVIQSTHTAKLTYPEGGVQKTLEWSFSIAAYTKDSVASRIGAFTIGSGYTGDAGGRSGQPGDYAVDFPVVGSGPVYVADASMFNVAAANDEISVAFSAKKYDIAASSAFWANSPSSNNGQRGYQTHLPWSDNTVYFDHAGCCNADQRLSGSIADFPSYTGETTWWNDWHHFIFSKKGGSKQVWIDGVLFLDGADAAPLPKDFTDLFIGSITANGSLFHGVIDDFAVFSTQLTEADAVALAGTTRPPALPASKGLLAYWSFNDIPPDGIFLSFTSAPKLVEVTHLQGPNAWDLSKVSLKIDGTTVAATPVKDGAKVVVRYVPTSPFAKVAHTATLTYPTSGGGTATREWSFTVNYTLDVVGQVIGTITGAANFTANSGGHSGQPGDYAMDLGKTQAGQSVSITDLAWMNAATANDELSIAGWQKLWSVRDSAFVWGVSPISNGGTRGWGTHTPWSNNNLYFDTAGCCSGGQRTSGPITDFPGYSGNINWWNDWHHFVFQKKGSVKEIWIDGELFITGDNIDPLPTDFTQLLIGYNPVDNGRLQGIVDDVAVFGTALVEADIKQWVSGTLPTALPASTKLLAYWNFNDAPATSTAPTLALSRAANGSITLTFTGKLQTATALTGAGAWSDVQGATSGMTVQPSDPARFYRAASQ